MNRICRRAVVLAALCSAFPAVAAAAVSEVSAGGTAVGLSPAGTVVVGGTDATGGFVDELRADGTRVRRLAVPAGPVSVAADAGGAIYVVDTSGNLSRYAGGPTVVATEPGYSGVAIGADGTILGLKPAPDCGLVRLSISLEVLNTLAGCGIGTGQLYELEGRLDMSADLDGSLLVAQPELPKLTQFSPAGAQVGSLALTSLGVSFATGAQVAAAPAGRVWIAPGPRGGSPVIWRTDGIAGVLDMQPLGLVAPRLAAGIRDMVVAADGTAYIALQAGGVVRLDGQPEAAVRVAPESLSVAGAPMTLDASLSWQPFAAITRYEWDLDGDGAFETDTGTRTTTTIASAPRGAVSYRVRVTGSAGGTATGTFTITPSPSAPIAALAVPEWAVVGRRVVLGAGASASAGGPLSFQWDLDGSGTFRTAAGPRVNHVFRRRGRVVIGVRASSSRGESNTTFRTVTVLPKPPRGRIGVIVAQGARTLAGRPTQLDLVWPAGARRAVVANSPSFARARVLPLNRRVPWRLTKRAPGSISTVYVRFIGPGVTTRLTYSDEVITAATR